MHVKNLLEEFFIQILGRLLFGIACCLEFAAHAEDAAPTTNSSLTASEAKPEASGTAQERLRCAVHRAAKAAHGSGVFAYLVGHRVPRRAALAGR